MTKPNYIINEILINILQGAKREFEDGKVTLQYDTDKIMLDATIHEDDHVEVELWIGSDKQITIRSTNKDLVFDFVKEHYGKQRKEWSDEDIQDSKDDLSFDVMRENRF